MERGALMKPRIKKQTHYSVLLMRDDGEVRSFRMKNTTLRALVTLFLTFLLVGAGGIGVGVHYWKRFSELAPEYRDNERALADARRELADLRNIKAVASAQSNGGLTAAMNTEVGVDAPAGAGAAPAPSGAVNATAGETGGVAALTGNAGMGNGTAAASRGGTGDSPVNEALEGGASLAQTSAEGTVPSLSADNCPVRLNEFSAQATSQQTLRIRYDLSVSKFAETGQDNGTVVGSAKYVAVFTNGTRLDLAQQSPVNARFAISRMKPMLATSRLPQGYTTAGIERLDVFIELADGVVYKETYPFPQ